MEKPPFQFGLKAIFAAMTVIAVLMAAGLYAPPDIANVVLLAVLAFAEAVALYAILTVLHWTGRVCGWVWKNRPFGSRNRAPESR